MQSLKCMYVFRESSVCDDAEVFRSQAQRSVHRHLFNLVAQGRPKSVLPPVAAARGLLGDKFDDQGSSRKVRPFGSAPGSTGRTATSGGCHWRLGARLRGGLDRGPDGEGRRRVEGRLAAAAARILLGRDVPCGRHEVRCLLEGVGEHRSCRAVRREKCRATPVLRGGNPPSDISFGTAGAPTSSSSVSRTSRSGASRTTSNRCGPTRPWNCASPTTWTTCL